MIYQSVISFINIWILLLMGNLCSYALSNICQSEQPKVVQYHSQFCPESDLISSLSLVCKPLVLYLPFPQRRKGVKENNCSEIIRTKSTSYTYSYVWTEKADLSLFVTTLKMHAMWVALISVQLAYYIVFLKTWYFFILILDWNNFPSTSTERSFQTLGHNEQVKIRRWMIKLLGAHKSHALLYTTK